MECGSATGRLAHWHASHTSGPHKGHFEGKKLDIKGQELWGSTAVKYIQDGQTQTQDRLAVRHRDNVRKRGA